MPTVHAATGSQKILSVLYCGKSRHFGGDFAWRMSTSLNRLAENIEILGLSGSVEILVADWGSETPLLHDLELTESAKSSVHFVLIPPPAAATYDGNSGFSAASALNCAARRASGTYLMLCDFDLYIPLETMANLMWHLRRGYFHSFSLQNSFFWGSTHVVPNDFFHKEPERKVLPTLPLPPSMNVSAEFVSDRRVQEHLDDYIRSDWSTFAHEPTPPDKACETSGAVLVLGKEMFSEARGWNEGFSGAAWNGNEISRRLLQKYRWDDLESHGLHFLRLGMHHYGASSAGDACHGSTVEPDRFAPNPPQWGLGDCRLDLVDGYGLTVDPVTRASDAVGLQSFDSVELPYSVREIVSDNPLYRDISARFPYLPLTWFTNSDALGTLLNTLYEQFLANAVHSQTDAKIRPIRLDSDTAADYCLEKGLSFDLIYIDGDHTTVGARADIAKWSSLLSAGGYICGDDWGWQKEPDNVAAAVISVARDSGWQVLHHGNFWLALPGPFSVEELSDEKLEKVRPIPGDEVTGPAGCAAEKTDPEQMKSRPLISIITVCKNSSRFIRRCIESVLAVQQEYGNIEYLVQDGASTDGTLEIFAEYATKFGGRFQLFSEPDSGSDEAFWKIIKRCKGEFIACCLADEELLPKALDLAVDTFSRHPDSAAIFGWICTTDENGQELEIDRGPEAFDIEGYLCGELTPHLAASFFRRSSLEAIGLHSIDWKYGLGEFELWARLGMHYAVMPVPAVIARYARRSGSQSGSVKGIEQVTACRLELVEEIMNAPQTPTRLKSVRAKAFAGQYIHAAWHYLAFEIDSPENGRMAILEALKYQAYPEHPLYPSFVTRLYRYGFELYRRGQFERALDFLGLVHSTGIGFENLYLHIAAASAALGRLPDAREAIDKELSFNSNNIEANRLKREIDSLIPSQPSSRYDVLAKAKTEMMEKMRTEHGAK